jgi:hypothetical protein
LILAAASLALAFIAVAGVAWVVLEPRYWFEDAYSEKGPTGDKGPRGEHGPPGPTGPIGPDAQAAVADLALRVDEAESSLADLASRLDDLESGVSLTDLQSSIEEAQTAAETAAAAAAEAQSTADDVAQVVDDLLRTQPERCRSDLRLPLRLDTPSPRNLRGSCMSALHLDGGRAVRDQPCGGRAVRDQPCPILASVRWRPSVRVKSFGRSSAWTRS